MYKTSTMLPIAAKIMSHEYANSMRYWTKKNKVIKTGKELQRSGRQKTYNSDSRNRKYKSKYPNCTKFKRLNWKQSERYFKKLQSLRPIRLGAKTDASRMGQNNRHCNSHIFVETISLDNIMGTMRLAETNCPYTIIHEFAHLCGNMHHDIGFRRDVIKLLHGSLEQICKDVKGQFKKTIESNRIANI